MQPLVARRPRTPAALAGITVVAAGGLYFVNPNSTHVPLCPLHSLTGVNCPLCGGTRAAYALLHGRFGLAVHDNAFAVLVLPVALVLWLAVAQADDRSRRRLIIWTVVAVGVIFGVVRNLPIGAGLAPPA